MKWTRATQRDPGTVLQWRIVIVIGNCISLVEQPHQGQGLGIRVMEVVEASRDRLVRQNAPRSRRVNFSVVSVLGIDPSVLPLFEVTILGLVFIATVLWLWLFFWLTYSTFSWTSSSYLLWFSLYYYLLSLFFHSFGLVKVWVLLYQFELDKLAVCQVIVWAAS